MEKVAKILAEKLLKISAVKLQPSSPFVWASGWYSPIYIDNRKTLSYPDVRNFIKVEIARIITEDFGDVDAIAGVSTGAIAQGALASDVLGLPYVYVRSTPKDHGLENLIEGSLKAGQKVVIIEDLLLTGYNSLKAIEAIRNIGCEVIGVVSMFSYDFPEASERFAAAGVKVVNLSNYTAMLEEALRINYIKEEHLEILREWREDPENWIPDSLQNLDEALVE